MTGREDEARKLFNRLLNIRNDVGLLSEQYDPHARRLCGNFPQAFTHIGLINAALSLAEREDREHTSSRQRSQPVAAGEQI